MQLSLKAPIARAPVAAAGARRPRVMICRSSGPHPSLKDVEELGNKVADAIKEAEEMCKGGDAQHCAAAWDNVEELSAAAAHKKVAYQEDKVASDPLEAFCDDNPDADECRVYDD